MPTYAVIETAHGKLSLTENDNIILREDGRIEIYWIRADEQLGMITVTPFMGHYNAWLTLAEWEYEDEFEESGLLSMSGDEW